MKNQKLKKRKKWRETSGDEEGIHVGSRNSIGKTSEEEKAMDQQGVMRPHRSKRTCQKEDREYML